MLNITFVAAVAAAASVHIGHPAANFRVCLSAGAAESGITQLTVPARTLFEGWGPYRGDIRTATISIAYRLALRDHKVAQPVVLTLNPVHLSLRRPCGLVEAKSLISTGWGANGQTVRMAAHHLFEGDWAPGYQNGRSRPIDDAVALGVLVATPMRDISATVRIDDLE